VCLSIAAEGRSRALPRFLPDIQRSNSADLGVRESRAELEASWSLWSLWTLCPPVALSEPAGRLGRYAQTAASNEATSTSPSLVK